MALSVRLLAAMATLAGLGVGLWQVVAGVGWINFGRGVDYLHALALVASGPILIGASLALVPLGGRVGRPVLRFIGVARAINWLPVGMFASMAPPLQVGWWALQPLLAAGTPEGLPGRMLRFVLLVPALLFLYEAARDVPTGWKAGPRSCAPIRATRSSSGPCFSPSARPPERSLRPGAPEVCTESSWGSPPCSRSWWPGGPSR